MREKTYWRIISISPVLIPLVSFFGPMIWNNSFDVLSPAASTLQIFSLGTLFISGVPYIMFLIITQLIIWSKPPRWDRITSLIAPLLFLPAFLAGFQIYWSITAKGSWLDSPRALVAYSSLVLIVGYLFVGLTWGLRAILRGIGILNSDEINQTEE
jgi:hypothetical protein